jgi:hypothetical protein
MRIRFSLLSLALGFLGLVSMEASAITVCSSGADYTRGPDALRALSPGGELLFCAGETHEMTGFYGLGDLEGAYIGAYGLGEIPTLTGHMGFIRGETARVTFDGLRFRGDRTNLGILFDKGSHDITITNSIIENFKVGVFVKNYASEEDKVSNISLTNSVIQNNTGQGFLGGGPGLYIGYNTFLNNGSESKYDHNIYVGCKDAGDGVPCPQLIEFNELEGSGTASNYDAPCEGAEIVAHGYSNGLVIRNNLIRERNDSDGKCYGIMVNPSYSTLEIMSNLEITGNHIFDVGLNSIYVEGVDGVYIADNVIHNTPDDTSVNRRGIFLRTGTEYTRGGNRLEDVTIENNIIRISQGVGIDYDDDVTIPLTIRGNDVVIDSAVGVGLVRPLPPGPIEVPNLADFDSEMNGDDRKFDLNNDGGVGLDDIVMAVIAAESAQPQ